MPIIQLSHSPGTDGRKPAHSSISIPVRQWRQTAAQLQFCAGGTHGLRSGLSREKDGETPPTGECDQTPGKEEAGTRQGCQI